MSKKRVWQGFWQLADPKIWVASTVPILVGTALAYNITGKFNLYWFIWTLIGVYFIEIGKNAVNEFVDYASGVDRFVSSEERTPFSGGKKTIVDGLLTVKETKVIAFFTMLAGAIIGLYIALAHEPAVLWVGAAGFILAIIYSLPPFKLAYRGLGELTVGLTFGPLIVMGTYLVQAHTVSIAAVLVSLPVGLLIANVLIINQYPDYRADKKGKKFNWVVRLGKKEAVKVYALLYIISYLSTIVIFMFLGSFFWLLPFVSLPLAVQAVKIARNNYNNLPRMLMANMKTVQVYQLFGVTLILAAILDKVI